MSDDDAPRKPTLESLDRRMDNHRQVWQNLLPRVDELERSLGAQGLEFSELEFQVGELMETWEKVSIYLSSRVAELEATRMDARPIDNDHAMKIQNLEDSVKRLESQCVERIFTGTVPPQRTLSLRYEYGFRYSNGDVPCSNKKVAEDYIRSNPSHIMIKRWVGEWTPVEEKEGQLPTEDDNYSDDFTAFSPD